MQVALRKLQKGEVAEDLRTAGCGGGESSNELGTSVGNPKVPVSQSEIDRIIERTLREFEHRNVIELKRLKRAKKATQ